MALINIGNDSWLSEYESCDKLQRDIMELLSLRNKESKSNSEYSRLSVSIRLRLKQFNNELEQLKLKLNQESKTSTITFEESERRARQLEILRSKNVQVNKLFENHLQVNSMNRNRLMGVPGAGAWATDDDELLNVDQEQSIDALRVQQQKMAQDQEKGLEELSKIISRQKNIAETISTEVDLHNEIIEDLGDHINRTDMRVINETQQVKIVSRKDRTCGYWIVIVLLFISIVTVAVV